MDSDGSAAGRGGNGNNNLTRNGRVQKLSNTIQEGQVENSSEGVGGGDDAGRRVNRGGATAAAVVNEDRGQASTTEEGASIQRLGAHHRVNTVGIAVRVNLADLVGGTCGGRAGTNAGITSNGRKGTGGGSDADDISGCTTRGVGTRVSGLNACIAIGGRGIDLADGAGSTSGSGAGINVGGDGAGRANEAGSVTDGSARVAKARVGIAGVNTAVASGHS